MNKILDRVAQAYNGELGDDFSKKTRFRINWIVNNTRGQDILDIGTSQGIVPLILGREGKRVEAIDIEEASIEYAKSQLEKEHESVRKLVNFRTANFMTDDQLNGQFDTIILTEVLEHISDPINFLLKIDQYLKPHGKLIVTVPFGINDFYDHKRTYYIAGLYEELSQIFGIEDINFLGKWTGVICEKKREQTFQNIFSYDNNIINKLEEAFYNVEREHLNKIEFLQSRINSLQKNKSHEKDESLEKIKKQLIEEQIINQKLIQLLNYDFQSSLKINKNHEIKYLNSESIDLEDDSEHASLHKLLELTDRLSKELEEFLVRESNLLEEMNIKNDENSKLKKELKNQQYKYNALRNSKLGKITMKYWNLRRKLRR